MKSCKFFVILFFAFSSCNYNKPAEKELVDFPIDTTDTIEVAPKSELPITSRYFDLIKHIDSLGYLFDTLRYMRKLDETIEVDKYILFEIEKEYTVPFFSKALNEEGEVWVGLLDNFDLQPLEKVQKVMLYYLKKVEPQMVDTDGTKWYPDGMIEEWTFENERRAKKAAQELIDSPLGLIYFNTGAFVCQKENNMYIFYSRASAFMYDPQKKFFNWLVTQNDIELYRRF